MCIRTAQVAGACNALLESFIMHVLDALFGGAFQNTRWTPSCPPICSMNLLVHDMFSDKPWGLHVADSERAAGQRGARGGPPDLRPRVGGGFRHIATELLG